MSAFEPAHVHSRYSQQRRRLAYQHGNTTRTGPVVEEAPSAPSFPSTVRSVRTEHVAIPRCGLTLPLQMTAPLLPCRWHSVGSDHAMTLAAVAPPQLPNDRSAATSQPAPSRPSTTTSPAASGAAAPFRSYDEVSAIRAPVRVHCYACAERTQTSVRGRPFQFSQSRRCPFLSSSFLSRYRGGG